VTSFDETFSRELVFFWPQETDDFIAPIERKFIKVIVKDLSVCPGIQIYRDTA